MVGSRVYVGGLPFGVRERDLEKFFKGFGRTRDILIKNGYGFVEFEDYRDADDAVYELNGKELLGERVVVEPARGIDRGDRGRRDRERDRFSSRDRYGRPPAPRYEYGPPTRTEYRLTVENLSSRVSWQDLKDYMRQAGEVTYADAHKQHRNEGVVEFASSSDLRAAMEKLDNTELNGRRIRLVEDRRGGGGGGSRRRSRSSSSRSRSRSRARRTRTRSRSRSARRSRTASRSASRSKSRAKTKSPVAKSRSRSKARSASPHSRSASPVRRSRSPVRRSRSKSASPHKSASRERSRSASKGASPRGERKAPSKSRSRSHSRSHSGSPPPRENGGRASSEAK